MRAVLADASSLILCARSGLIQALVESYEIRITPAVRDEIVSTRHEDGLVLGRLTEKGLLRTVYPGDADIACAAPSLHGGERSILAAYMAGHGEFILGDDLAAIRICMSMRIPHINAILVAKLLFFGGCINQDKSRMAYEILLSTGHYSKEVKRIAGSMGSDELHFFLPA